MAPSHATDDLAQYITIQTTAARLSICTRSVRRLIADGTLPAIRLGHRTVRIPAAAVAGLAERAVIPTVTRTAPDRAARSGSANVPA